MDSLRATAAGFGAVVIWSTSVALTRSIGEQIGPLTAAVSVYAVAGIPALLRFFLARRTGERPAARYLFGCGALFIAYGLFFFLAIVLSEGRLQAMEVGLLNYFWPVLTLLFCLPLLRRRPGALLLPGTFLALAGIYLVTAGENGAGIVSLAGNLASNPVAYGMGLAAAVSWALYSALARAWSGGGGGGVELFLPATALVLLPLALFAAETNHWNAATMAEIAVFGMASFFSYRMWDLAMRRGNIVLVAAFSYLTPLLSSLVSSLYLKVVPGPVFWAGCLMLVAGSLASWHAVSFAASRARAATG